MPERVRGYEEKFMLSLYSVIWTLLVCLPLVVGILLIRGNTACLCKTGVAFPMILSVFCFLRLIFPIEFPGMQRVIEDPYLFSHFMHRYSILELEHQGVLQKLLYALWFFGVLLMAAHFIWQYRKIKREIERARYRDGGRAEGILWEIAPDCSIPIWYTACIAQPFLKGPIACAIYLPKKEYTDGELRHILLHEALHWRRRDAWKKCLINALVVIFWWNPLLYVVRLEVFRMLELRCDATVKRQFSAERIVAYMETIQKMLTKNGDFLPGALGLGGGRKSGAALKQRFACLLYGREDLDFQKKINRMAVCLGFLWLFFSYYFILQPRYDMPKRERGTASQVFMPDDAASYVEQTGEGAYIFHYGIYTEEITPGELASDWYDDYPLVER